MERWWLAVVLCLGPLPGCSGGEGGDGDGDVDADGDLDAGADGDIGSDADGDANVDPAEALDWSLEEQAEAVEEGRLGCEGLVEGYLERVAARDEGPEGINAFIALDEDVEAEAARLEEERGRGLPLLCGVIGVKDNIDVDGFATTAGSLALEVNLVDEDAPLVARLRAAGALVVGKTNLSEWANFRGHGSTSGWSSLGGQTRNGFDPAYNPCGSSSGSAAAVAAGLVVAAIGTETDGSITCPAAMNGVVGMKPTVGLVSRAGIVPISFTQDTAGPITRTVRDAALLLTVMAGPDPLDRATDAIPEDLDLDFVAALGGASLEGVRLGVVRSLTGYDDGLDAVFDAELARMEEAGATLVPVLLPSGAVYGRDEMTVLLFEFKAGVNDYLASHPQPGQAASLGELIEFNIANADAVMPYFGQELFEAAQVTPGLEDPAYLRALDNAASVVLDEGILAAMDDEDLDALVAPTTGPAFMTAYETGDVFSGIASGPAAVGGAPHITLPMGQVRGLPVGLSIFAAPWQDGRVLALAHAYETLDR